MKIEMTDAGRAAGWTADHGRAIVEKLEPLGDRFALQVLRFDANDTERVLIIDGRSAKHGPLIAEMRFQHDFANDARISTLISGCYEAIVRDLEWIESGRALAYPTVKQAMDARQWLTEWLHNDETKWLAAHPKHEREATSEPLHAHLWNLVRADAKPFDSDDVAHEIVTQECHCGEDEQCAPCELRNKITAALNRAERSGIGMEKDRCRTIARVKAEKLRDEAHRDDERDRNLSASSMATVAEDITEAIEQG